MKNNGERKNSEKVVYEREEEERGRVRLREAWKYVLYIYILRGSDTTDSKAMLYNRQDK